MVPAAIVAATHMAAGQQTLDHAIWNRDSPSPDRRQGGIDPAGLEPEGGTGQVVQDHRHRTRCHPGRVPKVRVDPVGLPMGEGEDGDQDSDSDVGQEPPAS